MKSNSILFMFVLFILVINETNAQLNKGYATYDIRLAEDRLFYNATLFFDNNQTLFKFKSNPNSRWERFEGEGQAQVIFTDSIGHLLHKKFNQSFFTIRDFCSKKPYIFIDSLKIDWQLGSQQKNIGGMICKNAHTNFRGRNYTAWYSEEIPLSVGPWKFSGLPGLIVEVADEDNAINILLKTINFDNNVKVAVIANNTPSINRSEFIKCKDKEWEDRVTKDQANMAKLRAKYPDLELDVTHNRKKSTTELEND